MTGAGFVPPTPSAPADRPAPVSRLAGPAALFAAAGPPPELAADHRAGGWWRDETFLHDLYRTAATAPDRPAIVSHRAHRPAGHRIVTLDHGQLARYVDRFAGALRSLGLGPGDPVAFQLPSWWEASALTLACLRIGAVAVPVLPTQRAHGLERVLGDLRVRLCVVPDAWEGFGHAEALAELAHRLPWLRHRVVLGDAAATGAVDFAAYFLRTPHEQLPDPGGPFVADPDRTALAVTVMGLGDSFTSTLHTPNTLYAGLRSQQQSPGLGPAPGEVSYSALPLTSLASLLFGVYWPVAVGGTAVFQDVWDPDSCLDLLEQAGVTRAYAAPVYWAEVLAAQRRAPRRPAALRLLLSGGRTRTPAGLLAELPVALGAPAVAVWGSPEVGLGTVARGETPAERSAESDGRPLPGLELSPLSELPRAPGGPAVERLRVRGPAVCLACWPHGAETLRLPWEQDQGWLDTGDLARADGLGGVQVVQWAGHRTGAIFLVPVAELEDALLAHPAVREAAVVGYPDPEHGELTCAVVVPAAGADPPGLPELRRHLTARGLAEAFLPTRLELAGSLPRDAHGGLRAEALRSWLARLRPGAPRPPLTRHSGHPQELGELRRQPRTR
ncbi:AMP-binding protein [Kitasatospora sp. NBC_00070]|uniref:AMP-binding protein n=1 Tax=Kitasatospora sp. NBC_00070 TaxID=2975962 RepID=UPI0032469BE6